MQKNRNFEKVASSEIKTDGVGISISSWNKDKKITEEILKEVQYS